MKKLLYFFSAVALFFTSCSGEDSPSPVTPLPVLVTRITSEENSVISTREFTYDGTKFATETTSDGSVKYYTYNGDYITYIETKNSSNTTIYETYVEYNSNNKISRIINLNHEHWDPNFAGTKREFTYNPDGTIVDNLYVGTLTEQNLNTSTSTFYSDSHNQIIKIDDREPNNVLFGSYEYSYDDKKSPFCNVIGYDPLLFHFFNRIHSGKNNRIYINDVLYNSYSNSFSYIYNSFDFPITCTNTDTNGVLINYEYLYNQ